MAQVVSHFTGLETGDASEMGSIGAGASVQSTTVRTGGYALKCAATRSTLAQSLSVSQTVNRLYLNFPALPGGSTLFFLFFNAGPVTGVTLKLNTNGTVQVVDGGAAYGFATTNGTSVLSINTWHLIELLVDNAAGGSIQVWVNGFLDIDITHTNLTVATTRYDLAGAANPNEYFFDDMRMDTGGVSRIGDGRCIARQGIAGTPTNNAWTKNGLATAALCWSETPFGTTNNCSSSTSAAAQTMLVAPFSTVQAGYGAENIGVNDVINACKTAFVGKRATAGSPSIRRRIGGVNTDTAKAMTTADAYYDDGIWTTTRANLDTAEAGAVKAADGNLTTIEDVWMMADVTPFVWTPPASDAAAQIARQRDVEMVGY